MAYYSYPIATIASSGTDSDAIDLQGHTLCGFYMPAAFTGTAVTFKACQTSTGTFVTVQKDGADLSYTVAVSKYVTLMPSDFAGINFLKIVSGSAEGASRSIVLVSRPVA